MTTIDRPAWPVLVAALGAMVAGAAHATSLGELVSTLAAHREPLSAYSVRYRLVSGFLPSSPTLGQFTTIDLTVVAERFRIANETILTRDNRTHTLTCQWAGDGATWLRHDPVAATAIAYDDQAIFAEEQSRPLLSDNYRHLLGDVPFKGADGQARSLIEVLGDPTTMLMEGAGEYLGLDAVVVHAPHAIASAADARICFAPEWGLVCSVTLVAPGTGIPIIEYAVTSIIDVAPGLKMPAAGEARFFSTDGMQTGSFRMEVLDGEQPMLVGGAVELPDCALDLLPTGTAVLNRADGSTTVVRQEGLRERARDAMVEAGLTP